ncbi:hypothetical protein [Tengunoibacter tsumagoiensis]|uniref:Uncharacterized protein n=1 Tax=Tengunoibacter tsumagoiensis TaxID=2014871 RepID=A0A402A5R6_9CHLR|nr:hypothetical protein [Tengunoibacter tsumagoiensis]GCE14487.1 hypothetical protein KTT_43460 [Tengunoibacter tsumagoiensis]
MEKQSILISQANALQKARLETAILLPPPNRLIRPLIMGGLIELVTIVTLMLLSSSARFSVFSFVLGIIGILIPLLLTARSFWIMTKDEEHSLDMMQEQDKL